MPHDAAVSTSANGAAVEGRVGKMLPPGPGEFVSVKGEGWKPAMTPVTTLQRNPDPKSIHHFIDIPVTDPKTGAVMMQPNPAAVDTIRRAVGPDATALPIAEPPEPKDAIKDQVTALVELQRASMEAQAQRDERMDKMVEALLLLAQKGK